MPISSSLRISGAMPERSKGLANTDWILSDTAGFAFWFLESPAGRTENKALIWELILFWMWGRLPSVLLIIPTCSAISVNSMVLLFIARGVTYF